MTDKKENKKAKVNLTMENVTEAVDQLRARGWNVIPFDSHNKIVKIPAWKNFQPPNKPSDEQYNEWYRNGTFNNGLAIMLGKLHNNNNNNSAAENQDTPLYGIGIDCDNQPGIDLVLEALGFKTIAEASKKVIVNQHRDQNYRAHFILYSHKEIPKIKVYVAPTEGDNIDLTESPRVEILLGGQVLIVHPSIHKNGYPYEIPRGGTMDPVTMDDLQERFEQAFKKRGISYANNGVTTTDNNGLEMGLNKEGKIPIEVLFDPDYKVLQGNRNNELIRVANSLLYRNQTILEEYKIRELLDEWNKNHCVPPLEKKEVDHVWNSAKKFVVENNKRRAYERVLYQEQLKRQQEQDEFLASEQRKKEQRKPLSIGELARLEEEDKLHYAAGQLTSIGSLYKRVRTVTKKCTECGKTKVQTFPYPITGSTFTDSSSHFAGKCWVVFDSTCDGTVERIPGWISAINIEVSDNNTLQDTDKLRYILFGDDTKDVGIGENATLLGMIHIETLRKNDPASTVSVSYAHSIKYENREQEELSSLDVQAIKRFRKKYADDDELMKKFIGMTACHIIGHENIKEGILYMVTNAKPDKPEMRQRLHGIIISPPALAKTALLRYATTLMTRSTFETCQTSTGLSLFAMVEKDGDMKIIRLGPIARSLFAATDEFNRTGNSDQEKYLGAMQEGFFTSNKFGKGKRIVCPVTILASINPQIGSKIVTSESGDNSKIDLSEMNVIAPVMDRFDFKWYIMPMKDEEFDNLIDKKMEFVDHAAPDYSYFISMWIKYVKERYNPRLSDRARWNLKLAVKDLRRNNKNLSPRVIETLANATKARARFLLKDIADENDAAAIIKFYSIMIQGYSDHTIKPRDIIEIGVEECYQILAEIIVNQTIEYRFDDLLKKACNQNKQLSKYIMSGVAKVNYFNKTENKQARNVFERLLTKYPDIMIVSKSPIILQLPIDRVQSDQSDFDSEKRSDSKTGNLSTKKAQFDQSDQSDQFDQSDQSDRPIDENANDDQKVNENTGSGHEKEENKKNFTTCSETRSNRSNRSDCSKTANSVPERYHSSPDQVLEQKSERSDSEYNDGGIKSKSKKRSKYFTTSTAGTVESRYEYPCPKCDYSNANPSKITEHIEEVHHSNSNDSDSNSKGFGIGSGSDNGGLDNV